MGRVLDEWLDGYFGCREVHLLWFGLNGELGRGLGSGLGSGLGGSGRVWEGLGRD